MRTSAIFLAFLFAACGEDAHESHDDSAHGHEGRYGGHMIELGDHLAWAEVVHDAGAGSVTVHIWDAHVTGPRRLKAKSVPLTVALEGGSLALRLEAVADKLTGDTVGDSARFEARSERLVGLADFDAVLGSIRVGDTEFAEHAFHYGR